jgi:hypothetical protein
MNDIADPHSSNRVCESCRSGRPGVSACWITDGRSVLARARYGNSSSTTSVGSRCPRPSSESIACCQSFSAIGAGMPRYTLSAYPSRRSESLPTASVAPK